MIVFDSDDVLDFLRVLLFFELLGFLPDKFVEDVYGQGPGIFSDLRFRVAKRRVELLDFFLLVVGIFPGDGERELHGFRFFRFGAPTSPLRLKLASRGAEMARQGAFFLLFQSFAEHFAILGVLLH